MRTHNPEVEQLLNNYLPTRYSKEVIIRLARKSIGVTDDMVRNARNGRPAANATHILTTLIEIASEHKAAQDVLNGLISNPK